MDRLPAVCGLMSSIAPRVLVFEGSEFMHMFVCFGLICCDSGMRRAWTDIRPMSRPQVLLMPMAQDLNSSDHVLLLWLSEHVMTTRNVSLVPLPCLAGTNWVCLEDEARRRNEGNED